MELIIDEISNDNEIKNVIDNLHPKTKEELIRFFGKKIYKQYAFETVKNAKRKYLFKLKDNTIAGIFGVIEYKENVAGTFYLTKDILDGHKISIIRKSKEVIKAFSNDYELLFDTCYKKNKSIEKWLKMLGFKNSGLEERGFKILYIGNINLIRS